MKAKFPLFKTFYLGVLAGCYIAFGSCLAMTVGGACQGMVAAGNLGVQKMLLGVFGLPTGLMMVVTAGGELFTGNTAFMTAGVIEGKATMGDLVKNWIVSYAGNFIGSVLLAYLVFASGVMAGPSVATVKAVAVAKTSIPFTQAVIRGVLCNWLVVMGIWQATASKEIVSRVFAIWLPIMAFVTMGFEHSVANMFFLPCGLFNGAEVTWSMIIMNNLLPVTIGNTIAGAILMAGSYALMYGKPSK
jgi:formate transporter